MLWLDLCDFSDTYIVVKRRVAASFNAGSVDYVNNGCLDAIFPYNIFPEGSSPEQTNAARNVARRNSANVAGDRRNLIKDILFRNNVPFINCISTFNETLIDNQRI